MENNLKYTYKTDSLCSTLGTNTILYINYTSIFKKREENFDTCCKMDER